MSGGIGGGVLPVKRQSNARPGRVPACGSRAGGPAASALERRRRPPKVPVGGSSRRARRGGQAGVGRRPSGGGAACRTRPRPGLAAVGGEGSVIRVAARLSPISANSPAAVTTDFGSRKNDRKIWSVAMAADSAADLTRQLADLGDDWSERRDQTEHGRPPSLELRLADDGAGGSAQPCEQLGRACRSNRGGRGSP